MYTVPAPSGNASCESKRAVCMRLFPATRTTAGSSVGGRVVVVVVVGVPPPPPPPPPPGAGAGGAPATLTVSVRSAALLLGTSAPSRASTEKLYVPLAMLENVFGLVHDV